MSKNNTEKQMEQETILGIAPLLPNEKKYGFWDFFLMISGYAIATWCYTQGAYSAGLVNFKQLVLSTFGISIFFLAILSLPVIFSVRYGIDIWIWFRSIFGLNGSKGLAIFAVLANFPWYAVASSIFGSSMANLLALGGITVPDSAKPFLGCVSIILGTLIALAGNNAIKWMTRIMVPAMLGVGIIVVIIALTSVPFGDILAYQPDLSAYSNPKDAYMLAVEGIIAFAFSWTAAMFVLPRMCKKEKYGYWGTTLSYGIIAPFFIFAGGVLAIAMYVKLGVMESDPTIILANLASPKVALLSLLLVAFANVGTQAIGSNMNALVLKSAFSNVKYSTYVILLGLYVGFLTIWDQIVTYFSSFLAIETYLYAPMMSILFVDFFFVKKQHLKLKDAYFLEGKDKGAYAFKKGFNLIGIGCVIFGIICGCLVYNPITGAIYSELFYVITGSGTSFLSAGILYFIICKSSFGQRYLARTK
ncbi:MAG: cytosine permease [Clostridiaceae bacterium]|nr:cytosine permease [Clostridiaceae bacterium]